ncbi:MAG: AAA family ATPase [Ruminiclostridium sp.]|nr:AAA family ATPase [Ruminiclostridium sp.]
MSVIIDWIIKIILFIVLAIAVCLLPFIVMSIWYYIYFRFFKKVRKPIKEFVSEAKHVSFFKRLFVDFPRQFVHDRLTADPNEFGLYGFHLFVGEQGSGKTVATAEFLRRIKKQFPLCHISTNFEYKDEDGQINSWKDLVFNNNGAYGQADVIDEVQNWFSSNQSKDFPPEMIQEITQQRKQRKIFIGTTQRFERMAKPLREQVNYIYFPLTIAGCLTIVRMCKPKVNSDGELKDLKTRKIYFFVHDDELRNSFDTYHKIKKQAEEGYIRDNYNNEVVVNTIIDSRKPKRKR